MTPTKKFRIALALFIIGLVLSGVSALPLETLTGEAHEFLQQWRTCEDSSTMIDKAHIGLVDTYAKYPWLGYGTDWLGFGHFVIAFFFIGPYRHPETARGNLRCGIAACIAVIPFAMIAGEVREIPMYWRLVDCSFGVIGVLPLFYCLKLLPALKVTTS